MNGERPQTKTLERTDKNETNPPLDIDEEWKGISGNLSAELPVSKEQPSNPTSLSGELFTEDLSHPQENGYESNITARLSPEPLTGEKKNELLVQSLSDSAKDVAAYGEARAAMTPEQQQDFDEHREYAVLLDMQTSNPDAFNQEVAKLPPERRSDFYSYAKAEAKVARDKVVEQAAKLEKEEDFLVLHSLKFDDPGRFEEVFSGLSPTQKGSFDAFEASEDARMKTNNPEMAIPKLSTSGEKWTVSGELPEEAVASLPPKQPYQTAEQMREAGPVAQQAEFVNSIKAEEKPRGWARVKGWFSKKTK